MGTTTPLGLLGMGERAAVTHLVPVCYLPSVKRTRLRASAVACSLAFGLTASETLETRPAQASVSIAVSWDALVGGSTAAAVVTPIEATTVWQNGRIFTYTHVNVDRGVAGSLVTGGDAWVRTLGGVVDKIGQSVEGEASFVSGAQSLLFLRNGPAGTFDVTARGQGQFRVVSSDPRGPARVVRNRAVGSLVAPALLSPQATPLLATEVLEGLSVEEAAQRVASAWAQSHAH